MRNLRIQWQEITQRPDVNSGLICIEKGIFLRKKSCLRHMSSQAGLPT